MDLDILTLVTAILLVSISVLFVCQRFNIPSIVGFLLIGMVSGPFGLGLISDIEQVQVLAEGGIILLLFTIGLEFSFEKLLKSQTDDCGRRPPPGPDHHRRRCGRLVGSGPLLG